MLDGYSIILTLAPKDFAGKGFLNCARTTPLLPCVRVTVPHITRILVPRRSVFAL